MKIGKILGSLVLVAALAAACGGDSGGDAASAGTAGGDAGGSVTLTAADMAFSPPTLTAAAGDTIEFTNDDDAKHSFTVEGADIDEDADAGQSVSVDLGGVDAGSYDFICKYHPDMKGTLEVTG